MAIDIQIEERLTAVEEAVRELQRRLTIMTPALNWLERITGSFKDEPEFEKALEYGRAIREADRPPHDAGEYA
jgi:hypothetical protein